MLLAWPMCRSPFGSGGKRVRILAGSGPPWAWWAASPGLPAQRRLAEVAFARADSMTWGRKLLALGGGWWPLAGWIWRSGGGKLVVWGGGGGWAGDAEGMWALMGPILGRGKHTMMAASFTKWNGHADECFRPHRSGAQRGARRRR